jgi:hypothetical protein
MMYGKKPSAKTMSKPSSKKSKSFPDVNKDGKVTKKDVLMAKGIIPKKKKK